MTCNSRHVKSEALIHKSPYLRHEGGGKKRESREYYSSTRGRCTSLRFNKTSLRGHNGDLSARRKVIRDYKDIWNANGTELCITMRKFPRSYRVNTCAPEKRLEYINNKIALALL